jgi:hypothetical protein
MSEPKPHQAPKTRRWLQSAIAAASAEAIPALPFQRGHKRRPAALSAPTRLRSAAAR